MLSDWGVLGSDVLLALQSRAGVCGNGPLLTALWGLIFLAWRPCKQHSKARHAPDSICKVWATHST